MCAARIEEIEVPLLSPEKDAIQLDGMFLGMFFKGKGLTNRSNSSEASNTLTIHV